LEAAASWREEGCGGGDGRPQHSEVGSFRNDREVLYVSAIGDLGENRTGHRNLYVQLDAAAEACSRILKTAVELKLETGDFLSGTSKDSISFRNKRKVNLLNEERG
jgi:hypothetical protein